MSDAKIIRALFEAVEFAHSAGFEWPSDPMPPELYAAIQDRLSSERGAVQCENGRVGV